MPEITEQLASDPVIGDGIVTIPGIEGKKKMPVELGTTLSEVLLGETTGNIQAANQNSRRTADLLFAALQATAVQNLKDIGAVEGRTVSGILATPVASPAVQQK